VLLLPASAIGYRAWERRGRERGGRPPAIQHLAYKPKKKWLAEMKRRHMAHHFHDETGNFGITSFLWDKLFGTFYDKASDRPSKSATVFNLGYTPEVAEVYPHVARLSGGVATGHPRQRDRK
jgi:hypothetical protein